MENPNKYLVVDSDAHVVESARTWEFMDPSEKQFKPIPLETREEAGVKLQFWLIDGKVRGLRFPAFLYFRQKLRLVVAHLLHEGLIAGVFVRCRPKHHFCEHGRQVDSLIRKQVDSFPAVGWVCVLSDDAEAFEPIQTAGEHVRRNFFVRFEELLEGAGAADHHVADDEQ